MWYHPSYTQVFDLFGFSQSHLVRSEHVLDLPLKNVTIDRMEKYTQENLQRAQDYWASVLGTNLSSLK